MSVFMSTRKVRIFVVMGLVVHNVLYFGSNEEIEREVEREWREGFDMTLEGECKWFLGMGVKNDEEGMTMDQKGMQKSVKKRQRYGWGR